jgi:hypothetical protein
LREAHALRFGRLRDAIRGRAVSGDDATAHVLRLSIDDATLKDRKTAAALLGASASGTGYDADRSALLAHAATSREALVDVALAVAVARGENALTADRFDWRRTVVAEHARLVRTAAVHEFTPLEEALIAERSPYDGDQDAATPADPEAA